MIEKLEIVTIVSRNKIEDIGFNRNISDKQLEQIKDYIEDYIQNIFSDILTASCVESGIKKTLV